MDMRVMTRTLSSSLADRFVFYLHLILKESNEIRAEAEMESDEAFDIEKLLHVLNLAHCLG